MKRLAIAIAALVPTGVLLMALAPEEPVQNQINQLRADLGALGFRVAKLEHAAGQGPVVSDDPSATSTLASAEPVRTMILVSINETDSAGDHSEEIARLERECGALMNTVNAAADEEARATAQQVYVGHVRGGVRGWGGRAGGGVATTNAGSARREIHADRRIEDRYATQHAMKKRELDALKAADSEPRQIIIGHDGNTILALETKHDLADALNEIAIGDTVTWRGDRKAADDSSESWEISSIRKVQ